MTIDYRVLGAPGRDNSLLITVDSGQSQHRLLFDCGEDCLSGVSVAHVQDIETLFFSHFHVDHIAGFDRFLRMNWCRSEKPVQIFGPPGAIDVLHHRLRGFTWNLVDGVSGEWVITEVGGSEQRTSRFLTREGFVAEHRVGTPPEREVVYVGSCFHVSACTIDHSTTCLAYVVREDDRVHVDAERLRELQLQPGPWLKTIKNLEVAADTQIDVAGVLYRVGQLRDQLVTTSRGDTIAYLTDFVLSTKEDEDRVAEFLSGCHTLVCENNYRNDDADLAKKNYHMTSADVGRLAARVCPDRLVLFHLSDRYGASEWRLQLDEVREHFEPVEFPDHWAIPPKI